MGTLTDRILECYPQPQGGMLREMERIEEGIRDEDKDRIFEAILEDAGARVTVKDIRLACGRLGISYKSATHIKPRDHTCDCCEYTFKYTPCPSDREKLSFNFHDVCPMCGFQVCWTNAYRAELAYGREPKWYERHLWQFASEGGYGPGKPKGVYWSRARAEKEARIEKEELMDTQRRLETLLNKRFINDIPTQNSMRQMIESGRK